MDLRLREPGNKLIDKPRPLDSPLKPSNKCERLRVREIRFPRKRLPQA
jgi:hypothetical protein